MLKLYSAPRTRSLRVVWLLEELGVPYELEQVAFKPTSDTFFIQDTPTGKLPTLDDDGTVLCESGAIVEYILEKYGEGRLAPPIGTPERAAYLQWLHFSEASAFPPMGIVVWLTIYRQDADQHADLVEDARNRVTKTLDFLEKGLDGKTYLTGDTFSAADIMMGFTLMVARMLGLLGDQHPNARKYLTLLGDRPAYRKSVELVGGF